MLVDVSINNPAMSQSDLIWPEYNWDFVKCDTNCKSVAVARGQERALNSRSVAEFLDFGWTIQRFGDAKKKPFSHFRKWKWKVIYTVWLKSYAAFDAFQLQMDVEGDQQSWFSQGNMI